MFSFSIVGCHPTSNSDSKSQDSSDTTQHVYPKEPLSFHVNADYGMHIDKRVTILLGDSLIPFELKDYNIDTLVVGDYVLMFYTGTCLILQSYPSTITFEDGGEITDVRVTHGDIYEFEMVENPGDSKSVRPLDSQTYTFQESQYCINEDGTFSELNTYPVGTKLYGVNPADSDSDTLITAFYSYNPLPN